MISQVDTSHPRFGIIPIPRWGSENDFEIETLLIKSILPTGKDNFYEVAMKSILPLAELYYLFLLHTFDLNEEWAPQYRGAGVWWVGGGRWGLNIRALSQESSALTAGPRLLAWVMTNECFKIVTKQLFEIDFK